jgi:hypothetical protein
MKISADDAAAIYARMCHARYGGRAADVARYVLPHVGPVRVRKPQPGNDRCVAPTTDLEAHRAQLRSAFGNTMSDEFVDVMLGKLLEAEHTAHLGPTQMAVLCLLTGLEGVSPHVLRHSAVAHLGRLLKRTARQGTSQSSPRQPPGGGATF